MWSVSLIRNILKRRSWIYQYLTKNKALELFHKWIWNIISFTDIITYSFLLIVLSDQTVIAYLKHSKSIYWKDSLNTYLEITFLTKQLCYLFDCTFEVSINASKFGNTNTDTCSIFDAIQLLKPKYFSNIKFLGLFS